MNKDTKERVILMDEKDKDTIILKGILKMNITIEKINIYMLHI